MRRVDREVTDFLKMTDIMKNCECCRLGLVDKNEAYIVPMIFGIEIIGEQVILYFHCANQGRKIELISGQTITSFEMDTKHQLIKGKTGCDFSYLYQCIMGKGELQIVSDRDEKNYGLQRIMDHYTSEKQWEFNEKLLKRTTVLKLFVKTWSCKEHGKGI